VSSSLTENVGGPAERAIPFGAMSRRAPPSGLACRLVETAEDLAAHHAVRHQIFVVDQRLFVGNDRDERDLAPDTLHVVGVDDGRVVGAVRLYPLHGLALWQGDRLAVLPEARVRHLGALLVRFAVATAGERGGHTMVAHIQLPNVSFFEHLGWHADGSAGRYHGVMHQPMAIPLAPDR
jgi:putative N-acetyltransferase (TIGR04045 family)